MPLSSSVYNIKNNEHSYNTNNQDHYTTTNNHHLHDHTYASSTDTSLSIAAINVCGFKNKLDLGIIIDHINRFDIVCVSETKSDDSDLFNIPGYKYIAKNNNNILHKLGGIHGLGIFIKDNISKYFSVIDNCESDCVLWLKVEKELLGYDFIIGATYVPHEGSVFHDNCEFDIICSDIVNIQAKYDFPFYISGDFNARTGNLTDFISLEEGVNDFDLSLSNCISSDTNENLDALGINVNRSNSDKKTNNNGTKLIELCKNFDLRILNGRCGSDNSTGDFTFISSNGKSTIDYTLLSAQLLPRVKEFKVDVLDTCLSDKHRTIYTILRADNLPRNASTSKKRYGSKSDTSAHTSNNSEQIVNNIKTIWDANKSNDYRDNFDHDELNNLLNSINTLNPKCIDQVKIDDISKTLCDLLISPAKHIGISKDNVNYKHHNSNKKTTSNKPWFNKHCARKRAVYVKLKNKLIKDKSILATSKLKAEAKKYKYIIKKAKNDYFNKINLELKHLKTNDPKQFWKLINKSDNNSKNHNDQVDIDDLYNHFKNLGDSQNLVNTEFDPRNIKHSINEFINMSITIDEVNEIKTKLKNNKSCGPDSIVNEFIKFCPPIVIDIITKLFNVVLDTGIIPKPWCLGYIVPIYKKKGSTSDPNNYRGITLLSCIGKMFTAVLNARLTKYLDCTGLIGEEQAGFRAKYSTMDHIFSLHCIIDIYLRNKKKLYCAFVDYKKAFDLINRTDLWSKLISSGINGKIITVIYNLYNQAKSCVKHNNSISEFFNCNVGVRQGENLSPLLFSIFLNDLENHLRYDGVTGLNYINKETIKHLSDDDIEMFLKLYILLYADDTIVLAESADDLQKALNSLHNYCNLWHLKVNASKTKIIIFSRGKIRIKPIFTFGNDEISVCDDYTYLGIVFNYNGKFNKAISKQVSQAKHAMFALISKAAKLHLSIDITCDLFDKIVLPILLYGCEVWGFENLKHIEIFYRNFLRRILKVNKLTVNCMLYGEVGKYKIASIIKSRTINFWSRLVTGKQDKYAFRLYSLLLSLHTSDENSFSSRWINNTINIFNACGFSNIWLLQDNHNSSQLKRNLSIRLNDINIQEWSSEVNNNSFCTNYKCFKINLEFEYYLKVLVNSNRILLTKFRCRNLKFPNNINRFGVDDNDKLCNICTSGNVGDEYHYLFDCNYFNHYRSMYVLPHIIRHSSDSKMLDLFKSDNVMVLINLCKYIKVLYSKFST